LIGFGSLCAGTFGLGVWQTKRYFEKFELTEQRCKELDKAPLNAWDLIGTLPKELNARDVPSRRVSLTGRFDNHRSVLVGPRPPPKDFPRELLGSDTAGYIVVSPFIDNDG
jgi:cytochrome oxidase assembly protein ShyY1